MSDETPSAGYSPTSYGAVKTLAVRVSEDVRAQLDIIAQLNDRTVTEEIRLAIEAWIEKTKADPATQKRAESVRAEIEREAATKQSAISAIFESGTSNRSRTQAAKRE